ncbi:hypothetical protein BLOT_016057 [Blomia tropicalis]|nr:hypothetical protein BLOT_016057 [Blomia tropicalis]
MVLKFLPILADRHPTLHFDHKLECKNFHKVSTSLNHLTNQYNHQASSCFLKLGLTLVMI